MFESGYLALYIGPMKASKSTFATTEATRFADLGEKVLYINSKKDEERKTEGGQNGKFTSHNSSNVYLSDKVDAVTVTLLSEIDVHVNIITTSIITVTIYIVIVVVMVLIGLILIYRVFFLTMIAQVLVIIILIILIIIIMI